LYYVNSRSLLQYMWSQIVQACTPMTKGSSLHRTQIVQACTSMSKLLTMTKILIQACTRRRKVQAYTGSQIVQACTRWRRVQAYTGSQIVQACTPMTKGSSLHRIPNCSSLHLDDERYKLAPRRRKVQACTPMQKEWKKYITLKLLREIM